MGKRIRAGYSNISYSGSTNPSSGSGSSSSSGSSTGSSSGSSTGSSTQPQQPLDSSQYDELNNKIDSLIRKLKNYNYFKYDADGKEVLFTEFFPNVISSTQNSNKRISRDIGLCENDETCLAIVNSEGGSKTLLDYLYPKGSNISLKDVSYSNLFSFSKDTWITGDPDTIANLPIATKISDTLTIIQLEFHSGDLATDAGINENNSQGISLIEIRPIVIKIEKVLPNPYTRNSIKFTKFDDRYEIEFPEDISLINTDQVATQVSSSKLKIELDSSLVFQTIGELVYHGKFMIVADSNTKRYIIGFPQGLMGTGGMNPYPLY